MSKDRDVRPAGHGGSAESRNDTRPAARRRLLTTLGAGAAASAALPTRWTRPVAESVLLPAHAQTSSEPPPIADPGTECSLFAISFVWSVADYGDGECGDGECPSVEGRLVVAEPDGTIVGPGMSTGTSLQHHGATGPSQAGIQRVTLRSGAALQPGEYRIGVGFGDARLRVRITGCDGATVLTTAFDANFSKDVVEAARMFVASDGSISAAGSPAHVLF